MSLASLALCWWIAAAGVDAGQLFGQANAAERAGDPAAALALYERVLEARPGGQLTRSARVRIEWLKARSTGGFAPLSRFMKLLARPAGELGEEELRGFESSLDRGARDLLTREAWQLLGENWLQRDAASRARDAFAAMAAASAPGSDHRRWAVAGQAQALAKAGDAGGAVALLRAEGLGDSKLAARLERSQRRGVGRWLAWALIAVFAGAALAFGGLRALREGGWRAAFSPQRVAAGAWALGVPVVIAHLYDHAATDSFAWLAGGAAGVLAVSALAGEGAAPSRRPPLMALAVLAQGAVAYLVLDIGHVVLSIPW